MAPPIRCSINAEAVDVRRFRELRLAVEMVRMQVHSCAGNPRKWVRVAFARDVARMMGAIASELAAVERAGWR
jgi:hypothetical protein